uniref:Uncharacterized protein n=1 Tax=Anguilla anguilla TaxID=7936 RepID=A0A0E9U527_ANGAN
MRPGNVCGLDVQVKIRWLKSPFSSLLDYNPYKTSGILELT